MAQRLWQGLLAAFEQVVTLKSAQPWLGELKLTFRGRPIPYGRQRQGKIGPKAILRCTHQSRGVPEPVASLDPCLEHIEGPVGPAFFQ